MWRFIDVRRGKALETLSSNNDNGGNIVQWDYSGQDYSRWRIKEDGPIYSKIFNRGSKNRLIDAGGGSAATGDHTNISQYQDELGANNQLWAFEDVPPGHPRGGLVAEYKFENSPRDDSGREMNGTSIGGIN